MIEYLEKRMFVNRKSCNYYSNLTIIFLMFKLITSMGGSLGYFYLPMLTALSFINGIIELFEKTIQLNEKISEFRKFYKFYYQFLQIYKTKEDINIREKDFLENIIFSQKKNI